MPDIDCSHYAIPYYGRVAKYGQGFERVYLIACICHKKRQIKKTLVSIWHGTTAEELSEWLADNRVEAVFANDCSLALEKALAKYNIAAHWFVDGNAVEIAEQLWIKNHPERLVKNTPLKADTSSPKHQMT